MGTKTGPANIASALWGKTKQAVLALLFCNSNQAYYLQQIFRATGIRQGSVQRELDRLVEAGLVNRRREGNRVYHQANRTSPVFEELRRLMVKTAGLADVLRNALAGLSNRITVAFVYGSFAQGRERKGSDVDILVVGDVTFGEIVSALGPAQDVLGREVNPTVYPKAEFRNKLIDSHHFVTAVIKEPKVFLIGDERGLAELAG